MNTLQHVPCSVQTDLEVNGSISAYLSELLRSSGRLSKLGETRIDQGMGKNVQVARHGGGGRFWVRRRGEVARYKPEKARWSSF